MAFLDEQGVARLWSHISDKIEESNNDFQSNKNPLELALFFYSDLNNFDGDTTELKAQNLARYDVIVHQGQLTNNLEMSGTAYARELGILTRALEINPNLKIFGYLTARGFANSTNGQGYVGMTEYRTSPANVDHPIWTKEELYAYMNLMAHVGGDRTGETDAYGNPVLEGGFPLAGVFFDDYGFHFKSQNEHLLNQGDWNSIREKQNDLINYAHSLGLAVMPNSDVTDIFSSNATSDYFNPEGVPSAMGENDYFCVESYFLRSDYQYGTNEGQLTTYLNTYKDTYHSKPLTLVYLYAIPNATTRDTQVAATYSMYKTLCQGGSAIALHTKSEIFAEFPSDFHKWYNADGDYTYEYDTTNKVYTLRVNGHTITTAQSPTLTAYGEPIDSNSLNSCVVVIDGEHVFNNEYMDARDIEYRLQKTESTTNARLDALEKNKEDNSNLYHRAFIDDWERDYMVSDYTNYMPEFGTSFGGEDTGTTVTQNPNDPRGGIITLPKIYSWRRFEFNVGNLVGKRVEVGFEYIDVEVVGSFNKPNMTWEFSSIDASGTATVLGTCQTNSPAASEIGGQNRVCLVATIPENAVTLRFWTQRQGTGTTAWEVDCGGMYLVDLGEHVIKKTWYTNHLPDLSNWKMLNGYGNVEWIIDDDHDGITINFLSATKYCSETGIAIPADTSILKPGETWEIGIKEFYAYDDDGNDVTNKVQLYFGGDRFPGAFNYYSKPRSFYNGTTSELGEPYKVLSRVTVPETWTSGMPSGVFFFTKFLSYAGGTVRADGTENLYHIRIKGLYYYKLDEASELFIRGKDASDTYVRLNRVTTDKVETDVLESDTLYIVDDGSMFMTNFRGERTDLCKAFNAIILRSQTPGSTKQFKFYVNDDRVLQLEEI